MGKGIGLPDPLGIFGEPTDLIGRGMSARKALNAVFPNAAATAEEEKPVMPIPDDEEVKKRRRRSSAVQRTRGGRASTIFTEQEGLGG